MAGKGKGVSQKLWWDFRYIWMFLSTIWVFGLVGNVLNIWQSRWQPPLTPFESPRLVENPIWINLLATILVIAFIVAYVALMYRMYFGRSTWVSDISNRERWTIRIPLIVLSLILVFLPYEVMYRERPFAYAFVFVVIAWTLTSGPGNAFSAVVISTAVSALILSVAYDPGIALDASIYSLAFGFFTSGYVINRGLINELRLEQSRAADRAVTDERFRLARDLHDTVGHSMTQITLKAELARKLVDSDPARASTELSDIESLSRELSAQVRESIAGAVELTFVQELDRAEALLDSMSISFEKRIETEQLPAHVDAALAWCTRESVMNIVKHSGATQSLIKLQRTDGDFVLEIVDNGSNSEPTSEGGQGIIGMRSRLQSLGGSATFALNADWHILEVRIPV